MADWDPTWADRQTYGRDIPKEEVIDLLATIPEEEGGGLLMKHVTFLATMHAENSGLYEWARPIVWRPDDPRVHQTVDRGICAFNSYWWGYGNPEGHIQRVTDAEAFDWPTAVRIALKWLQQESVKGTKGAEDWDWRPLLDWQWHGYGTDRYDDVFQTMRDGINAKRAELGITYI